MDFLQQAIYSQVLQGTYQIDIDLAKKSSLGDQAISILFDQFLVSSEGSGGFTKFIPVIHCNMGQAQVFVPVAPGDILENKKGVSIELM